MPVLVMNGQVTGNRKVICPRLEHSQQSSHWKETYRIYPTLRGSVHHTTHYRSKSFFVFLNSVINLVKMTAYANTFNYDP